MFSIAQYRESLEAEKGSVAGDNYKEKTDTEIDQLILRQNSLKGELRRIDRTLIYKSVQLLI